MSIQTMNLDLIQIMMYLNDNNIVEVKMHEGVVMIYSGYTLNHHQMLNKDNINNCTFVNLASYGNKRLFQNMLKSFERSIDISNDKEKNIK